MDKIKFKGMVIALSAMILMQSCVVYHKSPVSVDEAVASKGKVKIYTENNEKYKFKQLIKEDGNIYGIQSLDRLDSEIFAPYVKGIYTDKRQAKVLLPFAIKEIYLKNKDMSTGGTVLIILGTLIAVPAIIYGIAVSSIFPW